MKYIMPRFLFLLLILGFVFCKTGGIVVAMDNSVMDNGSGNSNIKSQVRSIVDNILQLRGGEQYRNNDPYDNGSWNDNYSPQYNDGNYSANPQQLDGNDAFQNNSGQYNNRNSQPNFNGSSNSTYQNNNHNQLDNNATLIATQNREINRRIENAISELTNIKRSVSRNAFMQQRQRQNSKGSMGEITQKTDSRNNKTHWNSTHSKNKKCNKQIFTVKNIDTCNMRTNSYLSIKSRKSTPKSYALNSDYVIKDYSSGKSHKSSKLDNKIVYEIKSYGKASDSKTNTELVAHDNKKYTTKGRSYFAHKSGCPGKACG